MKRLILIVLLVPTLLSAQDKAEPTATPESKISYAKDPLKELYAEKGRITTEIQIGQAQLQQIDAKLAEILNQKQQAKKAE